MSSPSHDGSFTEQDCARLGSADMTRIVLLLANLAIGGASIAVYAGLMQDWINPQLNLSGLGQGAMQGAFFAGHLLGCLVIGRLMVQWKIGMSWSVTVGAVAFGALLSGVPDVPTAIIGRALAGGGFAGGVLLVTGMLVSCYPQRKVALLSAMHATIAGAAWLSMSLASVIAEALGGWSGVLWLMAGAAAVCGGVTMRVGLLRPNASEPATLMSIGRGLKSVVTVIASLAIAGYVVLEQSMTVFIPQVLQGEFAAPARTAAMVGGLLWLGIIIGRVGGPYIARRVPVSLLVFFGGVTMAMATVLLLSSDSLVAAGVLVLVAGIVGGPMVPQCFAWVSHAVAPERQTAAMATCQLAACLGGLAGPTIIGAIADGWSAGFALTCVAAATAVLVIPVAAANIKWTDEPLEQRALARARS